MNVRADLVRTKGHVSMESTNLLANVDLDILEPFALKVNIKRVFLGGSAFQNITDSAVR